jgi:hypothetical protein
MRSTEGSTGERLGAWWNEKWKIPLADLGSVLFVFAMFALFFVWVGLAVFGVEAEAVRAARSFFPPWFFFANLFLAPALLAFVAGPLPVGRVLRLVLAAFMLCSGSLLIVTRQNQTVALPMLGFLYLEAFWIIPRWNRYHNRKVGLPTPVLPTHKAKRKLRDLLLYIAIALVLVAFLVAHALSG